MENSELRLKAPLATTERSEGPIYHWPYIKSILIKGGQESHALAMEKIATYPAPGSCGQKELKGEFSYAHLRVLIEASVKAGCKRIKGLKKVSLIRC